MAPSEQYAWAPLSASMGTQGLPSLHAVLDSLSMSHEHNLVILDAHTQACLRKHTGTQPDQSHEITDSANPLAEARLQDLAKCSPSRGSAPIE